MAQSLAKILVHTVFSTKNRQTFLKDENVRGQLHGYTITVLDSLESPSLAVNSVEDHMHILCLLSRKIAVMKLIETVKTSTSKWIKTKGASYRGFYWQGGYGAFSVSESKREDVVRYIHQQEEHHQRLSFQEEFRQLCAKHGVEIDERYVWD
jgi:REP element-mobilizing transposase RayT